MNKLSGSISFIESSEHMSIVDIKVGSDVFSAIVLETPKSAAYLRINQNVELFFKETEVSVAKNLAGQISLRNRIKSEVQSVVSKGILTEVVFDYDGKTIRSIISTRSAQRLGLKEGDLAEWLIKTNEISLKPV